MLSEKQDRYVWKETGPDHFAHANAYARVASDMFTGGGFYLVVD